jgi:hypothetical protein
VKSTASPRQRSPTNALGMPSAVTFRTSLWRVARNGCDLRVNRRGNLTLVLGLPFVSVVRWWRDIYLPAVLRFLPGLCAHSWAGAGFTCSSGCGEPRSGGASTPGTVRLAPLAFWNGYPCVLCIIFFSLILLFGNLRRLLPVGSVCAGFLLAALHGNMAEVSCKFLYLADWRL